MKNIYLIVLFHLTTENYYEIKCEQFLLSQKEYVIFNFILLAILQLFNLRKVNRPCGMNHKR